MSLLNDNINQAAAVAQNEKKDHNVKQMLVNSSADQVGSSNYLASLTG